MRKLPLARSEDIVVRALEKEVLIYDLKTHKAYHLNETSSAVYLACDGKTGFDELRAESGLTDDFIFLALDELRKENLIETDDSFVSPFAGLSRREAIRKVGLGSMIALPVISSLVAPTAAMAQSAGGGSSSCSTAIPNAQGTCASGQRCVGGGCTACTPTGTPVPGGCGLSTVSLCCDGSCSMITNMCT